jgi:potassium-transporting ATPase KdpC subunit
MTENKEKWNLKPVVGLAVISLLVCGLLFPLVVTVIGQVFFPYQANGEIFELNGKPLGSNLIAQTFTLPVFFHPRNDSASGVDPDITMQDAYSQIPAISNATGISVDSLTGVVNNNEEGTVWIFGSPYVNVLKVNVELITQFPSVYSEFNSA